MEPSCAYCQRLIPALPGQNYCSRHTKGPETVKSNAFYLRTNKLRSESHFSRWTLRAVLAGYQYYESNRQAHLLHDQNYLILPEGAAYFNEIASEAAVEAIVVGFHTTFLRQALFTVSNSALTLLDAPDRTGERLPDFWDTVYPRNANLNVLLRQLKAAILSGEIEEDSLEEWNFQVVSAIAANHMRAESQKELIAAKKQAVRAELFHRLRVAKDFMDTQLAAPLSLALIGQAAHLSPFHFLRLFQAVYGQTPFRYIAEERVKKARYLLRHSTHSVLAVAQEVSFEDQSAFSRWFKRHTGKQPLTFRQKYQA